MAEVALAEEPFEIAVSRGADMAAAQRRLFVPVALRVGHVAWLAMIAVEKGARRDGVGPIGHRIGPDVVSGRDAIPGRVRYRAGQGTRSHRHHQNRNCKNQSFC